MKPRRTVLSDKVFRLPGGNEDNDLWVTTYGPEDGGPCIGSTWELTDEERQAIADGANVELIVWGTARLRGYPLARFRRSCWHRWLCRHGYSVSECSSGPYRCARCGALYEEVERDA